MSSSALFTKVYKTIYRVHTANDVHLGRRPNAAPNISASAQGTQLNQPSEGRPHGQPGQHGMLLELLSVAFFIFYFVM